MWEYRAKLIRVVDGDTLLLELDQGFSSRQEEMIRLLDVSAPELSQPGGFETKTFVENLLTNLDSTLKWPLLVVTVKNSALEPIERRSFTRYLGVVYLPDPLNTLIKTYLASHPEWGTGI